MANKEASKKIVQYVILVVTTLTGLLIYHFILKYEVIVEGFLGFAVIYFLCRLIYFPLKNDNRFLKLEFPGLIIDIIYVLFTCIALYLALNQLIKVFSWLIKIF